MKRGFIRLSTLIAAFLLTDFGVNFYSSSENMEMKEYRVLAKELNDILNRKKEDFKSDIQVDHAKKDREDIKGKASTDRSNKDGEVSKGNEGEKNQEIIEEDYTKEIKENEDEGKLSNKNIFKVERKSLLLNITMKEKIKLLQTISLNLSGSEIKKLYSMLNDRTSSDSEMVKKFDTYLRERLKEEHYDEIKAIAAKYIDFSAIE